MRRNRRRAIVVAAVACMLTGSVTAAPPSSSAGLPDLQVVVLSAPPAQVIRGHSFQLKTAVVNMGTSVAAASTTRFYLSTDKARGNDRLLQQVRAVGSLQPDAVSIGTTALKPPATTPPNAYYVLVCADNLKKVQEKDETNNCKASRYRVGIIPGPTSIDLIEKDLAAGNITAEQAMVYRVFATFGDSRLPIKYHGDDRSGVQTNALAEAAAGFGSASASAKKKLIPFLKAPAYPGTWEELGSVPSANPEAVPGRDGGRATGSSGPPIHPSPLGEPGWSFYEHPHARIWFRQGSAHAQEVAGWLYDSLGNVWTKLTTLMGRLPPSDLGPHVFIDDQGKKQDWGDGASGKLDIYIVAIEGAKGLTTAYPPGCKERPSFVEIDPGNARSLTDARDILSHEFMHVLQFTYDLARPCKEYDNLDDDTAHWAINYVYPADDYEHDRTYYLWYPESPLWNASKSVGWVFPLFLEQTLGPGMIPQIYSHTESEGPWAAVNDGLPGGLKEQWPKFALKNWNQTPVDDSFKAWDRLTDVPLASDKAALKPQQVRLGIEKKIEIPIFVGIPALARSYDIFDIADDVVKLQFVNGLVGKPGAAVQALIQLSDGTWKEPEDWTDRGEVTLCRDKPLEDVKRLVIISSNSTYDDLGNELQSDGTKVVAEDSCLPETYAGTVSGDKGPKQPTGYQPPNETWSGTVTFSRYTGSCSGVWWCSQTGYQIYGPTSGSVNWHISGTIYGSCSVDQSETLSIPPLDPNAQVDEILLVQKKPPEGQPRKYFGALVNPDPVTITYTCSDGSHTTTWRPTPWWGGLDELTQRNEGAGGELQGELTDSSDVDNELTHWAWDFSPSS